MFKIKLISALTLAAVAGMAQASPVINALPTSITFDGYCDGVTNITQFKSGYLTATHALAACGNTDTAMVGPIAMKLDGNKIGIAATDGSYPQFGLSFVYIIKSDRTWNLLSAEGGVLNQGTWTSGFAGDTQGLLPSFTH